MSKLILYTDGGARGNPGPAALGAVIYNSEMRVLEEISQYLGHTTNNQAEYQALFAGLQACARHGAAAVACFLDSELLVRQMNGEYKVKDAGLRVWHEAVKKEMAHFQKVTFQHIPREKNKAADKLVNDALDRTVDSR